MIRTDGKCLRCGGCISICPADALSMRENGIVCSEKCTDCRICIKFCPVGAIKEAKNG